MEEFPSGGAEIASLKNPGALQHNLVEVKSTVMRMKMRMSVKRVVV